MCGYKCVCTSVEVRGKLLGVGSPTLWDTELQLRWSGCVLIPWSIFLAPAQTFKILTILSET